MKPNNIYQATHDLYDCCSRDASRVKQHKQTVKRGRAGRSFIKLSTLYTPYTQSWQIKHRKWEKHITQIASCPSLGIGDMGKMKGRKQTKKMKVNAQASPLHFVIAAVAPAHFQNSLWGKTDIIVYQGKGTVLLVHFPLERTVDFPIHSS